MMIYADQSSHTIYFLSYRLCNEKPDTCRVINIAKRWPRWRLHTTATQLMWNCGSCWNCTGTSSYMYIIQLAFCKVFYVTFRGFSSWLMLVENHELFEETSDFNAGIFIDLSVKRWQTRDFHGISWAYDNFHPSCGGLASLYYRCCSCSCSSKRQHDNGYDSMGITQRDFWRGLFFH